MFFTQELETLDKRRLCPLSSFIDEPDSDDKTYFKKHVEPSDIAIPATPQNEGMTEIIADNTIKIIICENNSRRALFPNTDLILCDGNANPAPLPACGFDDEDDIPIIKFRNKEDISIINLHETVLR